MFPGCVEHAKCTCVSDSQLIDVIESDFSVEICNIQPGFALFRSWLQLCKISLTLAASD